MKERKVAESRRADRGERYREERREMGGEFAGEPGGGCVSQEETSDIVLERRR